MLSDDARAVLHHVASDKNLFETHMVGGMQGSSRARAKRQRLMTPRVLDRRLRVKPLW
jgi:hypothetical protein